VVRPTEKDLIQPCIECEYHEGNVDMPGGTQTESADSLREGRRCRTWLPQIATAIVLPLVLLGLIEVGLRAFSVGYPTALTVPCTVHGQAASCYNLFFPAPFFPPGMIKTPQAYAIPGEKVQGTYRIFVLGESAAMGDPDPAYAFSRYLEVMLRVRYPSMKFEVVNTGSVAINSHVLLPIARGLALQRPDLFIIYSGNNEVVGPYGPGTALTSSGMSMPVIRGNIWIRSTRIGQMLTRVGTQKREWGGMEMFLDKQVPASSPLMKSVYENFEKNLRDTIDVARESGARVIVSTVATNVKDCAPFASSHRADLSESDLHSWNEFVRQGSDFESSRNFAEALKVYQSAEKIDGQYAELEFRIARVSWDLGDYRAAKEHFYLARDLDTLRFRADSKINESNRAATSSRGGVELLDADEILSERSANGIIGSDLVYEHVHMTPAANYLLARAMFTQIASKLPSQGAETAGGSDIPSEEECEQLLALTGYDRLRMVTEMAQRLQKPPFTNQVNHSDQVLRLMFKTQEQPESSDQTVSQYEWAIRQKPDDRVLRYNYGLFLFQHNRTAAMSQLQLSRPWDGFPVFAPDGTTVD
jgi:tetratricopeptide (TPR) repeat protein